MLKFNINNYVYFKPTEYACEVFKDFYKGYDVYISLTVDDNGFSRLQGWRFMQVFGEHMTLGGNPIIEGCEIYIEEDKLERVNA